MYLYYIHIMCIAVARSTTAMARMMIPWESASEGIPHITVKTQAGRVCIYVIPPFMSLRTWWQ